MLFKRVYIGKKEFLIILISGAISDYEVECPSDVDQYTGKQTGSKDRLCLLKKWWEILPTISVSLQDCYH